MRLFYKKSGFTTKQEPYFNELVEGFEGQKEINELKENAVN
ncbi:hypothetical protein [Peribacillus simplex]|nr:hypothetical protein [Peribacillus simplex]MEC1398152.1 hypothetical protein [Peribacillus simplex]MED3986163.1 hypothetical protein [Peribacillus simplex]MED4096686.1 hypothetical protein [Peribacillus simplex]